MLVLSSKAAKASISEKANSKSNTSGGSSNNEDGEGDSGDIVRHPRSVDGGVMETEVGDHSLGSAQESEPSSPGGTIG